MALAAGPDTLVVERGVVRHRDHAGQVRDSPDGRRVLTVFEASPFSPPAPSAGDPAVVRSLVREGALVDLDGVVFAATVPRQARDLVVDVLADAGRLTVADIRTLLGSTRKYVVPICGWLDRTGVTRRRSDDRVPGPTSGVGT